MTARGFTLTELLMAIAVASMVVGGLAGISATAARTQAREYRHGMIGLNVAVALKYLRTDLENASWVSTPSAGTLCVQLCTSGDCINAEPPASGSINVTTYKYCRVTAANQLRRITTTCSGTSCYAVCPNSGTCETASGEQVAENISLIQFTRPAGVSNQVDIGVQSSWTSEGTGTETFGSSTTVTVSAFRAAP